MKNLRKYLAKEIAFSRLKSRTSKFHSKFRTKDLKTYVEGMKFLEKDRKMLSNFVERIAKNREIIKKALEKYGGDAKKLLKDALGFRGSLGKVEVIPTNYGAHFLLSSEDLMKIMRYVGVVDRNQILSIHQENESLVAEKTGKKSELKFGLDFS